MHQNPPGDGTWDVIGLCRDAWMWAVVVVAWRITWRYLGLILYRLDFVGVSSAGDVTRDAPKAEESSVFVVLDFGLLLGPLISFLASTRHNQGHPQFSRRFSKPCPQLLHMTGADSL